MTWSNPLSQASKIRTAWVLIAIFLWSPFLGYLAMPMPMKIQNGATVWICTLQGMKEIAIDSISSEDQVLHDMAECPAFKLFQLANAMLLPAPPKLVEFTARLVGLVDQTRAHQHHSLHFSAYSTRAPPRV